MVFVCVGVCQRPVEAIAARAAAAKAAQSAARSAAKSAAIATGRHGHESSYIIFAFCVLEKKHVYVYVYVREYLVCARTGSVVVQAPPARRVEHAFQH